MEGKTGNLDGMGVENTEQAERNKLSKKSSRFLIVLPFLLPLFFIGKTFGWWQKEFVARGYIIGIESNGKVYELGNGGVFAFSKSFIRDKNVFLKAGAGTVCFISALAEQQYQLNSETTVNPFFQGSVTFISNSESSKVYCQEEKNTSMRVHFIRSIVSLIGKGIFCWLIVPTMKHQDPQERLRLLKLL